MLQSLPAKYVVACVTLLLMASVGIWPFFFAAVITWVWHMMDMESRRAKAIAAAKSSTRHEFRTPDGDNVRTDRTESGTDSVKSPTEDTEQPIFTMKAEKPTRDKIDNIFNSGELTQDMIDELFKP